MKAQRHRKIATLLRRETITSQGDLLSALQRLGERVTQATLSRDLDELGAFKARLSDGRVAYRLPEEPPQNGDHLRRMLAEFVTSVTASGPMVVLRTPPGCAHPVARALDTSGRDDVVGTIAGDDTVLVVCREGVTGRTVARKLEAMMLGAASRGA